MQLAYLWLNSKGEDLPDLVSQKGNIIIVGKAVDRFPASLQRSSPVSGSRNLTGRVATTLSRFRRISSLMIEVNDHEKMGWSWAIMALAMMMMFTLYCWKSVMILENYGPGNDDDVHLVLLEAAERLVATLRRRYRPRAWAKLSLSSIIIHHHVHIQDFTWLDNIILSGLFSLCRHLNCHHHQVQNHR